jgi:taurine--2-oxoglutarate transaminase
MGALTLTGDWRRVGLEPGLPGVVRALDCYCDRCPFGKTLPTCDRECARHIGDVLDLEGAGTVGAVFLEPVVGANGVLIPPPEYWPIVREACDRHGALLVADEVLTGFGRTGRCFAIEHFGVVPDLITCAKGLTGGYAPMGAVLVHERVAEHFDERVLRAGLTAYAHPIGCAAALAALDVYRDEDLFSRAAALEPALLGRFRAMAASIPAIRAVRGIGLLAAMEIDARPGFWPALAAALERHRLFVHTYPARDTLIVSPPLTIDEDTLAGGLDALSAALSEAVDHAHASRGETSP